MRHALLLSRALILTSLFVPLLTPAPASAQNIGGSISGVVRDTSGAVMPGVTVEASSPALIEGTRVAVSDEQGNYRILELRPGVYNVTFTLPGFSSFKREGLELSAGFTAAVNAEMRVGSLEETITVQGASPVVDTQNVRQQTVFTRELLDTLPTNRSVAGFATLTLGAQLNSPTQQNVGGNKSEAASAQGFTIHGTRSDDQKLLLDGMPATDASFAGNTNKNAVNTVAVQETIFQTGGISAEAETGGVQINIVPKEGGNQFSYYFNGQFSGPALQTENLSQALKDRGLKNVSSLKKVYDVGAAVGGPLRQDKLWFFGATRAWGAENYAAGNYFNKTQGVYLGKNPTGNGATTGVSLYTQDTDQQAYTNGYLRELGSLRLTWKASEKSKFNFSGNMQKHCDCFRGVDGLLAPEAVAQRLYGPTSVLQQTWNYPASNRMLLEAGNTITLYFSETGRAPNVSPYDISILEQSTGYRYGSAVSTTTNYATRWKKSHQINQRFALSYVTGAHTIKTGFTMMEGWQFDRTQTNHLITPYGEAPVAYRFDKPISQGGVPNRITEYTELEGPIRLKANVGIFVQDQWTLNKLTLNGGLRYSYFNAFVPATKLAASMFTAAIDAPAVKRVPEWNDIDPRGGAAYDVFGNGKTAVKASIGRYIAYEFLTNLPRFNGPTRTIAASANRTWTDSNNNYYPDCDLRNPLAQNLTASGGDNCGQIDNLNLGKPVPVSTYADDVLHDNRQYNWQGSVSLQQELAPGFALNSGYFRTWYGNQQATYNRALTPADFDQFCITAPTDSRLGDVSGRQVCGLFDVKPGKASLIGTDNVVTQGKNFGKQTELYEGFDLGMNGRFGQGGILQGGVSFGRTTTDSCDIVRNNPQVVMDVVTAGITGSRSSDDYCRLVNGNQTQFKAAGSYPLPWLGLEASGTYQNNPGLNVFATTTISSAVALPSLGRNLTVPSYDIQLLKPYTQHGDRISQLDVRVSKRLRFGHGSARAQFDVYNLMNTATVLAQNNTYGTAWTTPLDILGGRLIKFGLQLDY